MPQKPTSEFGRRRPVAIPAEAPTVKRSGHVALLLMGTFAVGGGAYMLTPRGNCEPSPPGMAAPAMPQTGAGCSPRGSTSPSFGHATGGGSRGSFFSGGGSSSGQSLGTGSEPGSGGVTRGGFGAFAHSFASHFSGGG